MNEKIKNMVDGAIAWLSGKNKAVRLSQNQEVLSKEDEWLFDVFDKDKRRESRLGHVDFVKKHES